MSERERGRTSENCCVYGEKVPFVIFQFLMFCMLLLYICMCVCCCCTERGKMYFITLPRELFELFARDRAEEGVAAAVKLYRRAF
jgi:hypothetical protein